jgi:hypothetical protein
MKCKLTVQNILLYNGWVIWLSIIFSCSAKHVPQSLPFKIGPVEKEVFILKPFGYDPTIKNFKTYLPSFKLQVYAMGNFHHPKIIDTIYQFHRLKSQLFIYKNRANRELFFAGNIYDSRIQLQNGIRVGVSKDVFYHCFTNMKPSLKDTVRISSKEALNSINFIFKGNKLKVIKIDNYID